MKTEIKLIGKYIILLFKNWILNIVLFLDLTGLIITYNTDIHIPSWVLLSFPFVAVLVTGYNIYKNSSPKISIDKPLEKEFEVDFPYSDNYTYFNMKFKTYIRNYGPQSGTLEDVKINFLGVNGVKDEFILRKMNILFDDFKMCTQKNGFRIMEIDLTGGYKFNFPLILSPNSLIPIYFLLSINLDSSFSTKNVDEMLEWIEKIHFELEYKIMDSFGQDIIKVPFIIKANDLPLIKKKAKQSSEEFNQMLK